MSIAPFVEMSSPKTPGYAGPPRYRMYLNMFPPRSADSCALLKYSAYGRDNGFSFADVTSSAVSSVLRGIEALPPREEMERLIDEHQRWVAERWKLDPHCDTSVVEQWKSQWFLHRAAGTGMENLGWGWKEWKFWFQDRKRGKSWDGAMEAIVHVNEVVKTKVSDKDLK